MDAPILTPKELKFIKRQINFPKHLILLLCVVISMAIFIYVATVYYYNPSINSEFKMVPGFDKFLEANNKVYYKPSLYAFSILIGVLIGRIIEHIKLSKILRKMGVDKI